MSSSKDEKQSSSSRKPKELVITSSPSLSSELQRISHRLASYVERVEHLEEENARLSAEIEITRETRKTRFTDVKTYIKSVKRKWKAGEHSSKNKKFEG